jgi:hypothetical protein
MRVNQFAGETLLIVEAIIKYNINNVKGKNEIISPLEI